MILDEHKLFMTKAYPYKKGPWTVMSTRYPYKNPWITVQEDEVLRPDGIPGIYGVVHSAIATGVIAINEHNEVYLVGQYRYATEQYSWEIVEGAADEDEEPALAARRELREEAGLTAEHFVQLGPVVHLSNCHSSEIAHIFLAQGLTEGASCPDGTEELTVRKVPLQEAYGMIEDGEIVDAITIIALYRVRSLVMKS